MAGLLGRSGGYDQALDRAGMGAYQWLLLLLCGVANAADGVEILAVSFVLPSATDELGLSSAQKGWLASMIFVGMMLGSWSWGALADVRGRRPCLALALLINGAAGAASAAAPSFGWILVFRLLSGFGVGGSIPIVFSYFGEFVPLSRRHDCLIYLAMFWMLGSLFAAGSAWAIIPGGGETSVLGWAVPSWRVFLVVSALPGLFTAAALTAASESPAFLLARGDVEGAAALLARIAAFNARHGGAGAAAAAAPTGAELAALLGDRGEGSGSDEDEEAEDDDDGDDLLSRDGTALLASGAARPPPPSSSSSSSAAARPQTLAARAAAARDAAALLVRRSADLFRSDVYARSAWLLVFVWFTLSFAYYGMALWQPEYFSNLKQDVSVYATSFYTSLSQLPGSLASLWLVYHRGAPLTLTVSMVLSSLAIFLYLAAATAGQVVAVSCVFAAVSVGGWNALNIVSTELFPSSVRSTAFGIFAAAGRVGAIAGNLSFAFFISSSAAVPLSIVGGMFLAGGLVNLLLPRPKSAASAADGAVAPVPPATVDERTLLR